MNSHFTMYVFYNAIDVEHFAFETHSAVELSRIGHFALNALHLFSMHEHALTAEPEPASLIITYKDHTFGMHLPEPVVSSYCRLPYRPPGMFDRRLEIVVRFTDAFVPAPPLPEHDQDTTRDLGEVFLKGVEAFDCLRYRTPEAGSRGCECVFVVTKREGRSPVFYWDVERDGRPSMLKDPALTHTDWALEFPTDLAQRS